MKVYLIGVGLGSPDTMTVAAREAIEACPVLIGAKRLLAPFPHKRCLPLIAAADIAAAVEEQEEGPVAVLLSGDIGFYSGAKNLYPLLRRAGGDGLIGIAQALAHRDADVAEAPLAQLAAQLPGAVAAAGENKSFFVALHRAGGVVGPAVGGD